MATGQGAPRCTSDDVESVRLIVALIDSALMRVCSPGAIDRIETALEPLRPEVTGVENAKKRLDSARRYLHSGETGAARYELEVLMRDLKMV